MVSYTLATADDFEFLASRWLVDLNQDRIIRALCTFADIPIWHRMYSAVASFLQDKRVGAVVESHDGQIHGFAVVDATASYQSVHIAHVWRDDVCRNIDTMLTLVTLGRQEVVAYDSITFARLTSYELRKLDAFSLLARVDNKGWESELATKAWPGVLAHLKYMTTTSDYPPEEMKVTE